MSDPSRARIVPPGIVLSLALVVAACDAPVASEVDPAMAPLASFRLGNADGAVSTPFRASLFTARETQGDPPECGDPPRVPNIQVGEGQATHLGRFSVVITFCMDVTDILDGKLEPGESIPYDNGFGILTAADGDELYMEISGAVLPSDHPDYDFEFQDPFTFIGGSGRFEGAGGGGMTDSFVVQAVDRTDHEWRGTLVLPAGR